MLYIYLLPSGLWVPITPMRWILSIFIPLLITSYGIKKKSLNDSGAIAGLLHRDLLHLRAFQFSFYLQIYFPCI